MPEDEREERAVGAYEQVYQDTSEFVDCIIDDYGFYNDLLSHLRGGQSKLMLHKKSMKKQIDEQWVSVIEKALPSIDKVMHIPGRDITETEKVQPIELSRGITARSIQHLAQHTDYIASYDGENIRPSKLLNVYKDETMMTYENKFVNTLIDRLYRFVERRFDQLKDCGQDEQSVELNFETKLSSRDGKATLSMGLAWDSKPEEELTEPKPADPLWERVEFLRAATIAYTTSEFAQHMNGAQVRPPILRTNAILGNRDLRCCLELWEFIESYDKIGYEINVSESAEKPDEKYLSELYSLLALQYVFFRFHTDGGPSDTRTVRRRDSKKPFNPRILSRLQKLDMDEFNVYEDNDAASQAVVFGFPQPVRRRLSAEEIPIRDAAVVALEAVRRVAEKNAE